ncbi:MAG: AMP-binding protein [Deltaproteobacteria bacterium]|nr:AMP-binding protein [Deltaproteobacteria bacterium]
MIHPYSHYLARAGRHWPNKAAIVDGGTVLTYAQLDQRASELAAGLRALGLGRGDRVAIVHENNHRYVESVCAVARAGGVFVPMLGALTPREHAYMLADSEARLVIALSPDGSRRAHELCRERSGVRVVEAFAHAALSSASAEAPDGAPDDLGQILYTSGTTGKPKGVMHSFASISAGIAAWATGAGIRHDDRLLGHFALSHFGGRVMDSGICTGATLVILPKPDPVEILAAIGAQRISVLLMVPTLLQMLLDHPDVTSCDLSSLRLVLYAAAPASPTLVRRAFEAFGPILATGFGQTEAYGLSTFLSSAEHHAALEAGGARLASIGREADSSVQVRLLNPDGSDTARGEVGEICVCAPWVMKGYWKLPELTAQTLKDGWLRTRDLGRQDDDGYFYLADRQDDMIISGGFNVYPREVEDVIAAVPGVRECCVVGVPDAKWGEAVRAIVVAASVDGATIIAHCKAQLAAFKVPKQVDFVAELPKSSVGKILRRAARAPFWQGRERGIHGAE